MIRKYIIVADDSIKGFNREIAKLEREWGAEEIEPSEDAISREAAAEMLDEMPMKITETWMDFYRKALNSLNKLPSVTPQPNKSENPTSWIPCSERLPEENGNYLVTVEANDGTASIKFQMVDHYGPKWLHEGKREKVIAWMPLPEPYNAESEENADE